MLVHVHYHLMLVHVHYHLMLVHVHYHLFMRLIPVCIDYNYEKDLKF